MMRGRAFLSHINVNDAPEREQAFRPADNVHLQAGKRAFTTHVNVNDDLRRELDALDSRPAWDGMRDAATVNGLPLYAPAQYLVQSVRAQYPKPTPTPAPTPAPSDAGKASAAGGSIVVERVDVWPWWIWPLAAAAAVAVRGN